MKKEIYCNFFGVLITILILRGLFLKLVLKYKIHFDLAIKVYRINIKKRTTQVKRYACTKTILLLFMVDQN